MSDELLVCRALNLTDAKLFQFVGQLATVAWSTLMKTSLLTLLLLVTIQVAQAQDLDTVTLTGRILDQNAAIIQGAQITVTLTTKGITRSTTSDQNGTFKLIQLPAGTYTIRAELAGFAPREISNISIVSSQTLNLNFTMIPAALAVEPVVITSAEVPLIDTKRTIVGATLNAREVERLPLSTRSPFDLIFI